MYSYCKKSKSLSHKLWWNVAIRGKLWISLSSQITMILMARSAVNNDLCYRCTYFFLYHALLAEVLTLYLVYDLNPQIKIILDFVLPTILRSRQPTRMSIWTIRPWILIRPCINTWDLFLHAWSKLAWPLGG